jgi:hypothetical protein
MVCSTRHIASPCSIRYGVLASLPPIRRRQVQVPERLYAVEVQRPNEGRIAAEYILQIPLPVSRSGLVCSDETIQR